MLRLWVLAPLAAILLGTLWEEMRDPLNRNLRGCSNCFSYGTRRSVLREIDRYVC
jgi:hypothetical protein